MKLDLAKLRSLLIPLLGMVLVVAFFVIGGNLFFQLISGSLADIGKANQELEVLKTKAQVLATYQSQGGNLTSQVSAALPPSNSTLLFVSQVRQKAETYGVELVDFKVGSEAQDQTLSRAQVSFEAEGASDAIFTFLASLSRLAPLSRLEKVRFSQSVAGSRVTVTTFVYWAALPKQLPSLGSKLEDLSPQEQQTLQTLTSLEKAVSAQPIPQAGGEREDPFTF